MKLKTFRKIEEIFWGSITQPIKGRHNKSIRDDKIKSFCSMKDHVMRIKRQTTEEKKILTNNTSDRGPVYKIYK